MTEELCPKGLHPRNAEHGRLCEYKRPTATGGIRTERAWKCRSCISTRVREQRNAEAKQRREEAAIQSIEKDMEHLFKHSILQEEWRERAACGRSQHEGFISQDRRLQEDARPICDGCPVRSECLESALAMPWFEGVAGGEIVASNQRATNPDKGMPYIVRERAVA